MAQGGWRRERVLGIIISVGGGELVEDYPEDVRGQSCLLPGYMLDDTPIHVVCSPKEDYLAV